MDEIKEIYDARIARLRPHWDWYTSRQGLLDILWSVKWLSVIFAILYAITERTLVSVPYAAIIIVISIFGWKTNRKEAK